MRSNDPAGRRAGLTVQAIVILTGMMAGLLTLAFLSPDRLDDFPRLCLWTRLTGHPCPACGTTHALCCLVHGDLKRALAYNRNVVVLGPVLVWVFAGQIWTLRRQFKL